MGVLCIAADLEICGVCRGAGSCLAGRMGGIWGRALIHVVTDCSCMTGAGPVE